MFEKQSYPIVNEASLTAISATHSLRCDSKQFESRFSQLDEMLAHGETFYLGHLLPDPLIKGSQPSYVDGMEGIPVINTLSIQKMQINISDCKYISEDDYLSLSDSRKLRPDDVLLTMDGGTSIGKPVLFTLEEAFTVDSHVAILRPQGITSRALVYLLASPLGQIQFQRFESGASGQTTVTEEDLRRFRFPKTSLERLEAEVEALDVEKKRIDASRKKLDGDEIELWSNFTIKVIREI